MSTAVSMSALDDSDDAILSKPKLANSAYIAVADTIVGLSVSP